MPFLLIAAESGIGAFQRVKQSSDRKKRAESFDALKLSVACSIILDDLGWTAVVSDNRKVIQ